VGQASVSTVNYRGGHATSPRLEFRLAGGWVPGDSLAGTSPALPSKSRATPTAAAAVVTSEIPKPVGFMPDAGIGGSEYCPKAAFPVSPDCDETPIPFLPGQGAGRGI
jgi:hypothetical protein